MLLKSISNRVSNLTYVEKKKEEFIVIKHLISNFRIIAKSKIKLV